MPGHHRQVGERRRAVRPVNSTFLIRQPPKLTPDHARRQLVLQAAERFPGNKVEEAIVHGRFGRLRDLQVSAATAINGN